MQLYDLTCELVLQIYKSTTGHVFDLSTYSKEPRSLAQLQYNSLHDPHLKSYLYRPDIQSTLLERGHVSVNLRVACSLREHNDYQYFLEREFLKLHNWEEEEKNVRLDHILRTRTVDSVFAVHFTIEQL